ncbi:hypothetical protein [Dickeya fangzhongdai]|uniref:hypothetical protein n=1 Tax=Dickeya fangzhongdai TaxID=1778540 RepID=UPI0026E0C93A|nr:hypothetical protein [Dickeya fangzhongdai]WKV50255.1 hypothetical protein PL145_20700 [Dickeya fangzhongdai]
MNIMLDAVFARKVGFVSHQNAMPILRELKVNDGGVIDLENLMLPLTSSPSFFPRT